MTEPVKSAYCGIDNGVLIAKIAPLYLADAHTVVDVTFGGGGFWTYYRPKFLKGHDLFTIDEQANTTTGGVDWRDLPEADESVDRVVFDPPYVVTGGRETAGAAMAGMIAAYGMHGAEKSPALQWEKIRAGCVEAYRILEPGGLLLLKAMDYVSSGRMVWTTRWASRDLAEGGLDSRRRKVRPIGFQFVDEIVLVQTGATGMQPKGRRQVHARAAHSVLMVFRKPRTRRRKAK